jgi:hypothetical protein
MKHRYISFLSNIPILFFFVSFPLGQLGAISLGNGIQYYVHDIAVIILLIQYVLRSFYSKQKIKIIPVLFVWAAFLCIAGISLLFQMFSVPFVELVRGSLYYLRFAAYTALTLVVLSDKHSPRWILGLYISGICISIFGIFQLLFFPGLKPLVGAGWDEHYGRLFSTFFDPNFSGMILVLTLVAGFYYIVQYKKHTYSFIASPLWIVQLVIAISIIATYSRSAYLACAAGMFLFFLYIKKMKLFIAVLLLGMLLYIVIPKDVRDVNRITRGVSSIARVENWQYSVTLFLEKPLTGYGFNVLRTRIAQDKPLDTYGIISRDASGVNSSILFVFITTGIVGGIVYVYWLYKQYMLYHSLRTVRIGIIGAVSLVGVCTFSLFNNGLFYPWILLWLSILLGVAIKEQQTGLK